MDENREKISPVDDLETLLGPDPGAAVLITEEDPAEAGVELGEALRMADSEAVAIESSSR